MRTCIMLITAQPRGRSGDDVLNQLLGLDVGQTVHTGDTITVKLPVSGWTPSSHNHNRSVPIIFVGAVAMTTSWKVRAL